MRLTLKIWRQPDSASAGGMHTYDVEDVSPDMSFLEMLADDTSLPLVRRKPSSNCNTSDNCGAVRKIFQHFRIKAIISTGSDPL